MSACLLSVQMSGYEEAVAKVPRKFSRFYLKTMKQQVFIEGSTCSALLFRALQALRDLPRKKITSNKIASNFKLRVLIQLMESHLVL